MLVLMTEVWVFNSPRIDAVRARRCRAGHCCFPCWRPSLTLRTSLLASVRPVCQGERHTHGVSHGELDLLSADRLVVGAESNHAIARDHANAKPC